MKNHYEILGIEPNAGLDDIKKAYRKLSVKFHPDKNEGDQYFAGMFRQINEAYQTLSDSNLRQAYDRQRSTSNQGQLDQERINQMKRELKRKDDLLRRQSEIAAAEIINSRKQMDKSDGIKQGRHNALTQVIIVKYCLWIIIGIVMYLTLTKSTSIATSSSQTDSTQTTKKKHWHHRLSIGNRHNHKSLDSLRTLNHEKKTTTEPARKQIDTVVTDASKDSLN